MRIIILALLCAFTFACSSSTTTPPADVSVEGPITLGGMDNVKRWNNLYFGGQPAADSFAALREAGVQVIVNLRRPDEIPWDEAEAARAAGIEYHSIPVTSSAVDPAAVKQIDDVVNKSGDRKVLVHCGGANRVGGWFALHLAEKQGMDEATAIRLAKDAGLRSPKLEQSVRDAMKK